MTDTTMEPKNTVVIDVHDEHGNLRSTRTGKLNISKDMITGMTSYGRQNVAAFVGGDKDLAGIYPQFMGLGSSEWPVDNDTSRSYKIMDLKAPLFTKGTTDVNDYMPATPDSQNPVKDPTKPDLNPEDDTRDTAHFTSSFVGANYIPLSGGGTFVSVTEAGLFTTAGLSENGLDIDDPGMFAYAIVDEYLFYERDTITVNWYISFPWNYICEPTDEEMIDNG